MLRPDLTLMKKGLLHRKIDLRSILGQNYTIKSRDDHEIGTTSGDKLFSEVYIGAIYDHYGRSWRVTGHGAGEIFVEPNSEFHHTKPTRYWQIEPTEKLETGRRWRRGSIEVRFLLGQVQVKDTLTGYREYDERTGNLVDHVAYPAASVTSYRTHACWLEVADHDAAAGGNYIQVHSLEHGLRATVPLAIPCDPYDLAGLTKPSGSMGHPTFFLYDAVKGGIGISAAIYNNIVELLEASRGIFTECKCDKSCPRCIQLPRCPEDNESTDRSEGIKLVDLLVDIMAGQPELLNVQTLEWYK